MSTVYRVDLAPSWCQQTRHEFGSAQMVQHMEDLARFRLGSAYWRDRVIVVAEDGERTRAMSFSREQLRQRHGWKVFQPWV